MKTDAVFKRAFNDALELMGTLGPGEPIPSETALSGRLGVSRTTVRKVLMELAQKGVVATYEHDRAYAVTGKRVEPYPEAETIPQSEQVETQFMEWMLRDDTRPGTLINERELAREFGVATGAIREFLNRFQHYGLIEKRPNAGWLFKGFTTAFALELFEIREMFELRSARALGALPAAAPEWNTLKALREEHEALLADIDRRFHDFSDLDNRFHRFINATAPNRFVDDFYGIISLIFHYHYQWNKRDEKTRNAVAIREHITYIDALESRNPSLIELACRAHLASAKQTLLRSTMRADQVSTASSNLR
ncbi:GntR family transcriptional regulator [Pelagibacterium halotolerans]|uniref:GntR family transcriptional regulator n=1 Tax=Pelagibacterium halotolerans TaxID=531813 RepID=UPI00384D9CA7